MHTQYDTKKTLRLQCRLYPATIFGTRANYCEHWLCGSKTLPVSQTTT
jgi:hypothetical protein